MNCLGIPVHFDPSLRVLCDSRGIWPFKRIVVGPAIRMFTQRETEAILMHEVGHCKLFHLEKRLLNLWKIIAPQELAEYCRNQEYQADNFVCQLGKGRELLSAFNKIVSAGSTLHPDMASRIERLLAWLSKA